MSNPLQLRALKGAPISIIIALLIAPAPLSNQQLSTNTGYSDKPIAAGLRLLSDTGLVQSAGRYSGWYLTTHTRQLLLGETPDAPFLDHETEFLRLQPSSSSSSKTPPPEEKPLPPQPHETENLRLDPSWTKTRDILIRKICIPPAQANKLIRASQQRGDVPAWLAYHGLRLLSYAQNQKTINNETWYTIRRLEAGSPSPDWYTPPHDDRLWALIIAHRKHFTQQTADQATGKTDLPY